MDIIKIIREEYQRLYENIGDNDWYNDEESLADKMLNQRFGISTQEKKPSLVDQQGKFIGYVGGDKSQPIYLNPKSLDGFDDQCRGAIFANGDLYLSKSSEVYHYRLFLALEQRGIIANGEARHYAAFPDKYVAVIRLGTSTDFLPSSNYGKDEAEYVQKVFDVANKSHPNYTFRFSGKFSNIIREEIQKFYNENINDNDWYDDEDSIADRMYAKIGIQKQEKQSQEPPTTEKGKYVGSLYKDTYPDIPMAIYLNPKNLNEFEPSVRAVLMQNGDIYVSVNKKVYHEEMLVFLQEKNIVPVNSQNLYYIKNSMPEEFIAVQRKGRSDVFEPSELLTNYLPEHFLDILSLGNEKHSYQFVVNDVEVMKGYYNRINSNTYYQ